MVGCEAASEVIPPAGGSVPPGRANRVSGGSQKMARTTSKIDRAELVSGRVSTPPGELNVNAIRRDQVEMLVALRTLSTDEGEESR